MKLHVITDQNRKVIATASADKLPDGTEIVIRPIVEGHQLYEAIEVPDEFEQLEPNELHTRVEQVCAQITRR